MIALLPLLQLAGLAWCFALPGILLALAARTSWSTGERILVGIATGALLMPMLAFCVACLAHTSITPSLVLGIATTWNAAGLGALALRARQRRRA